MLLSYVEGEGLETGRPSGQPDEAVDKEEEGHHLFVESALSRLEPYEELIEKGENKRET